MRLFLQHGFHYWFWKLSIESVSLALSAILRYLMHFNKFPLWDEKTNLNRLSNFPTVTQLVRTEMKVATVSSPQHIELFSETCWSHFTHPLLHTLIVSYYWFSLLFPWLEPRPKIWPSKHYDPWSKEDSFTKNYGDCPWHKHLSAMTCSQLKWPSVTQMHFSSGGLCTVWLSLSHFKATESIALYQTEAHCWGLSEAARASGLVCDSERRWGGGKWDLILWLVLLFLCVFHICLFVLWPRHLSGDKAGGPFWNMLWEI